MLLAIGGVIISWAGRQGWVPTLLLAVLAAAGLLGPLEQARLHTLASLNKHVGLGAWFAAIAAGYAIDRFIAAAPAGPRPGRDHRRPGRRAGLPGRAWAPASPGSSPPTGPTPPASSPSSARSPTTATATCWSKTASIARYYLPSGSQWQRWSSTRNIVLPSGASTGGPASSAGVTGAGNARRVRRLHHPRLLPLRRAQLHRHHRAGPPDHRRDLRSSGHYQRIAVIPYGTEILPGRHLRRLATRARAVSLPSNRSPRRPPQNGAAAARPALSCPRPATTRSPGTDSASRPM